MSILVPGLEAKHTWNAAITLNDPNAWPKFKLKRIPGLRATADPDDNREDNTGRDGEVERPSRRKGKTLTYEGNVRGRTLAELEYGCSLLTDNFDDIISGEMVINPDPLYVPTDYPVLPVKYRARPLTLDIPEELTEGPTTISRGYKRPFTLNIRMADARYYLTNLLGPFTTSALVSGAGASLPWTFPVIIGGNSIATGVVSVDNTGDTATDPYVDLYGPALNPYLLNETLGLGLYFRDYNLASGDFLRIDFNARTIKLNGVSDMRHKLDVVASGWWDADAKGLKTGVNVIRVGGDTAADPCRAVVTFYPATK